MKRLIKFKKVQRVIKMIQKVNNKLSHKIKLFKIINRKLLKQIYKKI